MREIKFRAFDKKTNTTREVVRIDFDNEEFNYMLRTPTKSAPKHWALRKSDEVELMQYTGLKDKNGKEIYEGDICEHDDEDDAISFVVFSCGCWRFNSWMPKSMTVFDIKEKIQVIGNIHEHPELLKT